MTDLCPPHITFWSLEKQSPRLLERMCGKKLEGPWLALGHLLILHSLVISLVRTKHYLCTVSRLLYLRTCGWLHLEGPPWNWKMAPHKPWTLPVHVVLGGRPQQRAAALAMHTICRGHKHKTHCRFLPWGWASSHFHQEQKYGFAFSVKAVQCLLHSSSFKCLTLSMSFSLRWYVLKCSPLTRHSLTILYRTLACT